MKKNAKKSKQEDYSLTDDLLKILVNIDEPIIIDLLILSYYWRLECKKSIKKPVKKSKKKIVKVKRKTIKTKRKSKAKKVK